MKRRSHKTAAELERENEALRQSEARYRRLHEVRLDGFCSVSMDGRIEDVSERFQQMVGYDAEELRRLTYFDLTPPQWHAFEADIVENQVLQTGQSGIYEKEYRRKDGTIFPVELRTTLVRDPTDLRPIGMAAVVRDITERKRAEKALRESGAALEETHNALFALINSTKDLIWSVDPETFGLVFFNHGLRDYFAKRGIDLRAGMTPADLLPPDFAERWRRFYTRALRDGPFVEEYLTASGHPVLLLSLNVIKRAGTVSGISVFGKDITDRIESEEALHLSERRFRTLIEDAPVAIRLSRNDRTLYANGQYLRLYGYDDDHELLGAPVLERWAPEVRDEVRDRIVRSRGEGDVALEYEGTALRKDGTRFPVHAAIGGVQLPDGAAVIAYLTDITERRVAETALRRSEERFRQVAESVSDFVWEVDAEGLYTYTSPSVETILGYHPNELVGRKHFYDLFAGNVRAELKRTAMEKFDGKEPFRRFPNTNVSREGRLVRFETSGVPLLDGAGCLVGYRGADSDVTAQWQHEQAMRDLTERLIAAQETERSRLASELHDDFCQRLALLGIQLHLMRQSPPDSPERLRVLLDAMYGDVKRLANDVRRMSHDLRPAWLEQLGLASAVGGLCSGVSATHGLRIQYEARDVPSSVPPAVALCLYRAAQEALQNVIKHSGASLAVVTLTGCVDQLHLVVRDDGRGFDVAAAQQGISLGLGNIRERVRSVSGRLAITSSPGEGTCVEVHVPLPPGVDAPPDSLPPPP